MTEQPHDSQLPRRVYFGAADRQHLAGKQVSGGDLHALEVSRRQKLAQTLIQRAEDVAAAVKTVRAMDNTGNTENALDHLQATLQDLTKSHRIFVDDLTDAIARYRDRRENHAVIADVAARNAAVRGEQDTAASDHGALGEIHVDIMPTMPGAAATAAAVVAALAADRIPSPRLDALRVAEQDLSARAVTPRGKTVSFGPAISSDAAPKPGPRA